MPHLPQKLEPHLAIPPISLPPPWPPSSTGAASAVSPQRTCRLNTTLLDVLRPRLAPRRRSRTAGTPPPIGDKFTYFSDIVRLQGSIPRAKTRRPSPLSATLFRNGDAGGTFARGTFARGSFARGSFARDPVERRRALDWRCRRVVRGGWLAGLGRERVPERWCVSGPCDIGLFPADARLCRPQRRQMRLPGPVRRGLRGPRRLLTARSRRQWRGRAPPLRLAGPGRRPLLLPWLRF